LKGHNVRRYVALVSRCVGTVARPAPYQTLWRTGCFCTRGAMRGYAVITLFSRWQKPSTCRGRLWHQEGVPGGAGAPATKQSS